MVTDIFSSLLEELGIKLHMKLKPDQNQSCLLPLPGGVKAQIELDKETEHVIIGFEVTQIPPGMFRQNVFREALISNGLDTSKGIFAYSKLKDVLILYDLIPIRSANGDLILDSLTQMGVKATAWKLAIERGELPSAEVSATSPKKSSMFGLK